MPLPVPPRRLGAAIVAPLHLAIAAPFTPTATDAASPPSAATTIAAGQAPAATVGRAVRGLVAGARTTVRRPPA
jgi:hypothetical protein